jgi:acyl carrier protein
MSGTFDSVVELLGSRFDIEPELVTPTANFFLIAVPSSICDSESRSMSSKVAVEISDDELAEMSTIGEVVAALEEKLADKGVAV